MEGFLVALIYWITFAFLVLVFLTLIVYIVAQGLCYYKKSVETTTNSKEEFELLGQVAIQKDQIPVHSPVN